MKKILKILLILAAALLLHLLGGERGPVPGRGDPGAGRRPGVHLERGRFFLGVDPARRRIMGIPDEGKI